MPPCSLTRDGDKIKVTVGDLSYTFNPHSAEIKAKD
jgi:hypothetical protein